MQRLRRNCQMYRMMRTLHHCINFTGLWLSHSNEERLRSRHEIVLSRHSMSMQATQSMQIAMSMCPIGAILHSIAGRQV